jgi:glycosyltransferase involved in cell wall biosynthesis
VSDKIPLTVVHHGRFNPETHVGGVETFARTLRQIFERVLFSTSDRPLCALARAERLPVICDNQSVRDWPRDVRLIGFRHGVAAEKVKSTRSFTDLRLAAGQLLAARRSGVTWVGCADWIRQSSQSWYRSPTPHIVYHPVDLERFDGKLTNWGSRLILHDARTVHKGKQLISCLQTAFPTWRFEALNCPPDHVPERLRHAAAFVHLSRYEGNSIVLNEAMAMDLPCLCTNVGLLRDANIQLDVDCVDSRRAFGDERYLLERARAFLDTLTTRRYNPRAWSETHASFPAARERWRHVLEDWRTNLG